MIDENWDAPSGGAAEVVPADKTPQADEAQTSGDEWWVRTDDGEVTETATADVVFGVRAGLIPPSSFVWREGMVDWLPLQQVPIFRLAALTRSNPPPSQDAGDGPVLSIGVEDAEEVDAASAEAVETAPPSAEPEAEARAPGQEPRPADAGTPIGPAPRPEHVTPVVRVEDMTPIVRIEDMTPLVRAEDMTPIVRIPDESTPIERAPRPEDSTPVVRIPGSDELTPSDASPLPVMEQAPPAEPAPRPTPPSSRPPSSRSARKSSPVSADAPRPKSEPSQPPPRKSDRPRSQSLRLEFDPASRRPSGSPPPAPLRSRPSPAQARPSGSPPPVPVRPRPSSHPPGDDDVTRVKTPGMILPSDGPRDATEPPRPKVDRPPSPPIGSIESAHDSPAKQVDSGDDEPALAVYSRPAPTLTFARPDLTELTPDPVAHAIVTPRRTSSPAIEIKPASIAPAEVPADSVPPSSSFPVPDFAEPADAAAWPSSLRPGSSRATVFVAAAAVVAAVVIGLSIRSGSRSPTHRAPTPPPSVVPAQGSSQAEPAPTLARIEASAPPAATPSAAPTPVETTAEPPPEPTPVARVTRRPPAEDVEPAAPPAPRRREPLKKQLTSAADDSVARLGSDKTEPEDKPPSKSFARPEPTESRSGLDESAPTKPSEGTEAKRRALTEPGF